MLRVNEIHTYYGDSYILQGISFDVKPKQVVGLLGRNGMGKTTLIRSIVGLTPARRGQITYHDQDIIHRRPFEIARLGISLVPQGKLIFSSLTVEENLIVCSRDQKKGWNLETVYEFFPPLRQRVNHPGNRLSGGEQQMLAIGRSLMTNPSLLLMDEPTEGLSPIFVQTVGQVIKKLQESGISILLVEQNLQFALKYTNTIHILSRGRIVHSSSPEALDKDTEIRSRFLGI
jgi:branched-chain amino acid transport system ATP-binding protein